MAESDAERVSDRPTEREDHHCIAGQVRGSDEALGPHDGSLQHFRHGSCFHSVTRAKRQCGHCGQDRYGGKRYPAREEIPNMIDRVPGSGVRAGR